LEVLAHEGSAIMSGHWWIPVLILMGVFMVVRRLRWRRWARMGYAGRGGYGGGYGCRGGYRSYRQFGGPGGPGAGGPWNGERPADPIGWILDDLHLTPEQRKDTGDIVTGVRDSAGEVRQAFQELRGKLGEALRGETFNESAVGDLLGHLDDSLAKARGRLLDTLAKLHQVLDPSQRAYLADFLERTAGLRRPVSL
jgi:Spy/CpxP family protein refolding chaperone